MADAPPASARLLPSADADEPAVADAVVAAEAEAAESAEAADVAVKAGALVNVVPGAAAGLGKAASCVRRAWHGAPGCCRMGLLDSRDRAAAARARGPPGASSMAIRAGGAVGGSDDMTWAM